MPLPVDAMIMQLLGQPYPDAMQTGDVVPLPIQPGPNAGPTFPSAYTQAGRQPPGSNITPFSSDKVDEYLRRMTGRYTGGGQK